MIAAVKRRVREVLRRFGYEVVPSKHVVRDEQMRVVEFDCVMVNAAAAG